MGKVSIIGDRSGRIRPLALRAAARSRQEGRKLVLYVPEQYTLQAERDLIAGLDLPGLLEIQVVSPRKLTQQVRERMGSGTKQPLGELGRALALYRVMAEKEKEKALLYYEKMAGLPGAVSRIGDALDELRESEITPEELSRFAEEAATSAERAKIRDLETIRTAYEELISEQFDDGKAVWTDTVQRLERSGLWDGADVIAYGFDTVRPDLRELVAGLCGKVNSFAVFLTMDREDAPDGRIFTAQRESAQRLARDLAAAGCRAEFVWPKGERADCAEALSALDRNLFAADARPWPGDPGDALALYAAGTPWEEAEKIAATLRAWHGEGIPWNAMAVARPAGAENGGLLRACLKLNGIPFIGQQQGTAADHPVCRMLLSALACLSDEYTTEDVITIARSGYSTLTEAEGMALEDYALAHGIRDSRWKQPFTAGDDAEAAEALRLRLVRPVEQLRSDLKAAGNAAGSVEALTAFLEAEGAWERLREEEETLLDRGMYREAVINRQIWKLLMDLLDQLWTLLGSRKAAIKDLYRMFRSALGTSAPAPLPEQEEGVVIGEVGHLLAGGIDALVLAHAQDGMLTVPESGWLSDPERQRLEEATGKTVGITREAGCLIRKYDFYCTMTLPRKRLLVTWSLRTEEGGALQPDGLVAVIRELFPGLPKDDAKAAGEPAGPATPQAALDGVGAVLSDFREGKAGGIPRAWEAAMVSLLHSGVHGETARQLLAEAVPQEEIRRLEEETARRLFTTDRLSVSRLEQFAACPYRHFIDYGLRPVKREEFSFGSTDAGDFFHEALDRYMKRASGDADWPGFTEERVDEVMDGVLDELTAEWEDSPLRGDALGEWTGETYVRRVRRAAQVLTRFAANSDFRTVATELAFGEDKAMPPLELPLPDGSRALIRGKIDRIDTYENGEGVWLRIVDNKSREKKPDAARMATGEQLQLMIYLRAAAQHYPDARLAGALYFPVTDSEVETARDDPAQIEADRIGTSRMKGLVTAREEIVRAMDRDISPYSVDKVFNQNGTVSKSASWAVDEETLGALAGAATEKAGELCGRMRSGEIEAAPWGDRNTSVCSWCEYRAICRAGAEKARVRETGITFADLARKNTLRESEK